MQLSNLQRRGISPNRLKALLTASCVMATTILPGFSQETTLSKETPTSLKTDVAQETNIATDELRPSTDSGNAVSAAETISIQEAPQNLQIAQLSIPQSRIELGNSLSNQVLQKELELLKLNTYLRIHTTDRSRLKPWRVFLYNLCGSGVSNAGIITVAAERWRTWQNPASAKRSTLKAGPILLLIGHSIVFGGLLIESTLDIAKDRKQHKLGYSPKLCLERAKSLSTDIQKLLKEREIIIADSRDSSTEQIAALTNEGKVLNDLYDLALKEYIQVHTRANRRKASRDISYLNGMMAAGTGGYIGSLMGLLAVSNRNPHFAGPAGLGFTLSGFHIVIAPVVGRIASNMAGKKTGKQLKSEFANQIKTTPDKLSNDITELKAVQNQAQDSSMSNRVAIYETAQEILKAHANMSANEKRKADKEFKERLISNTIVGGTKMGWGIQLMNAGFGFAPRPGVPTIRTPVKIGGATVRAALPKPKGAANVFSRRVAQGATTYIPGTAVWIADTLQARLRGELDIYNMGSQLNLPHQKLDKRLKTLESLESQLKQ